MGKIWTFRSAIHAAAAMAVALAPSPAWSSDDKTGVAPTVLSLPSGPGSIEGLGEAFQPALNTGTGKHSMALSLPPGPAGHAPRLALLYEGGDGNGPLGVG